VTQGQFIVIEGIDGAGTTTHTKRLSSALKARQLAVHTTREPSDGPIGMLLRQILTRRVVVPGVSGHHSPNWQSMALLFAADRMDHLQSEISPNLAEGITVISDRYDHSSVAYQSLSGDQPEGAFAWVKSLNSHARRPDLTIVLDVNADECARRRASRSAVRELYEDEAFQARLADFYLNIEEHFPGDRVVHIDANGDIDEVAAKILNEVAEQLGIERAGNPNA